MIPKSFGNPSGNGPRLAYVGEIDVLINGDGEVVHFPANNDVAIYGGMGESDPAGGPNDPAPSLAPKRTPVKQRYTHWQIFS